MTYDCVYVSATTAHILQKSVDEIRTLIASVPGLWRFFGYLVGRT